MICIRRFFLLLSAFVSADAGLLPVIMMHGVEGGARDFKEVVQWVHALDPHVVTVDIDHYEFFMSNVAMWTQVDYLIKFVRETVSAAPDVYKDGYTLMCHSQGAVLCRALIETMDDHNVHTYISLAGPHMGEYGIPSAQRYIGMVRELAHVLFYTKLFQDTLSVANYWKDPRPDIYDTYLRENVFLPVINNEPGRATQGPGKARNASEAARYKTNFLRLKKAAFFSGGPADDTIIPYDSAIFNFYNADATSTVPLEKTFMWTEDWLGLRALNESGRLIRQIAEEGACHICWQHDYALFDKYVAPLLPVSEHALLV